MLVKKLLYDAADDEFSLKVEYILKRSDCWIKNMEQKLIQLYLHCILPDLLDPRHARGMEILQPDYILKAVENQNKINNKRVSRKLFEHC